MWLFRKFAKQNTDVDRFEPREYQPSGFKSNILFKKGLQPFFKGLKSFFIIIILHGKVQPAVPTNATEVAQVQESSFSL